MKLRSKAFGNHFRRVGALLSSLVMICCMTAPALASHNWPASPSSDDFYSHPNSWYVWQEKSISGYDGYELLCRPMVEYNSSDTSYYGVISYSTSSGTYSYTSASGATRTYMYAFPAIPFSPSFGYLSDFPSFPVGSPSSLTGVVRLYPVIWKDYLSTVSDVFTDRSVFGFLTSWPSTASTAITDHYDHEAFTQFPIYVPSNIFFFGDKTDTSTTHTSFGIVDGDNDFWATPSNDNYLKLIKSHISNSNMSSFPPNFSIPSSDIGFVFCKRPSGDGMHVYNSEFNVTLSFSFSLWVPYGLLPSDVKVGDWISKADVESLQDQLVKDFDVNSDTLKNSKQNFDSWQNSNTIDTDVADTSLDIINGLMQNVGQFAFVVSLLCFGAVVLRVLIRKAVEG